MNNFIDQYKHFYTLYIYHLKCPMMTNHYIRYTESLSYIYGECSPWKRIWQKRELNYTHVLGMLYSLIMFHLNVSSKWTYLLVWQWETVYVITVSVNKLSLILSNEMGKVHVNSVLLKRIVFVSINDIRMLLLRRKIWLDCVDK